MVGGLSMKSVSKDLAWIWAAAPLVLVAVALVLGPGLLPGYRAWAFVVVLVLLALELAAIGCLVNKRPMGAFIDNRNRISLSKLQMAAWTVVVLSAFATAAAYNAGSAMFEGGQVSALAVNIPGELLLAMGISATSLVAAPALLSLKSQQDPAAGAEQDAQAKLGPDVSGNGKVLTRKSPANASWADLVTGDELGNAGSPDLGKIQKVLITLLLLGCYVAYIFGQFSGSAERIGQLPDLDKSFVWLMGISHASYLAYKAAPHTTSADPS